MILNWLTEVSEEHKGWVVSKMESAGASTFSLGAWKGQRYEVQEVRFRFNLGGHWRIFTPKQLREMAGRS